MEPGGKTNVLKREETIEEGQEEGQYNENL